MLLVGAGAELDDVEPKLRKVPDAIDPLLQDIPLLLRQLDGSRTGQSLKEPARRGPVPLRPQGGDVRYELRVSLDGGIRDLEHLVLWTEGDPNPPLLI